jgi:2-polyprenyl-6-methoxyphenol hydroxylase-like FAD-dependent oxidoreductase
MKIAIIGGGIAGCAAYLELRKHLPKPAASEEHETVIYEAYCTDVDATSDQRTEDHTHSSTLLVGGGLGIAPNGLNVLKRLDEDLLKEVARGGYVTATSNMKNKNGWPLFSMSTACPTNDTENPRNLHMVATSRHAFWRALRVRIPSEHIINKRICAVIAQTDGRNLIRFADGTPSVEADLVIGADGVRSTAKRALFPDATEDPYPPQYESVRSFDFSPGNQQEFGY